MHQKNEYKSNTRNEIYHRWQIGVTKSSTVILLQWHKKN